LILNRTPCLPTHLNAAAPAGLESIVCKCLEKDRNLRYQHASEISSDLKRVRRNAEPGRSFTATTSEITTEGRKRRGIIALVAVALVALGSGAYLYLHRTAKLTDKDTIVIADFANTTGDPVFDDALKTALNISLRQSPFLNVLPDSEITKTLQLMTRPTNLKLTPELAREVCQRAGSKAYVVGSISNLGNEYVLGLKTASCEKGDAIAQQQVTATSKEKVLDALGDAASKLRRELGESLATVRKFDVPLAEATTSSLDALKAYSLGIMAQREKGSAAGLPYHQRAVQLDPSFAMAYRALGSGYYSLSELGQDSACFAKAYQLREHASERERLAITADYYLNVTGELDKAEQTYQEQIGNYPRDSAAYNGLGIVYSEKGQYHQAVELIQQSLRLFPNDVAAYDILTNFLLASQHLHEARQIISEAQARKLDDFALHSTLYALAFLGSDSTATREQQQWFADKPKHENFGLSLASDTEAYSGHLGNARQLTKQSVDSAIRADSRESGAISEENSALREAAFGNVTESRRAAADGLELAPTSRGVTSEAALAFAMVGDMARAELLTRELAERFPLDTQMQSLWLPAIRAQLALDKKNPTVALEILRAASTVEFGSIPFVNNISCLYHLYVRGQVYLAAGQGSAAATEFQKILDHSGIVWNCWTGALARLGLARANALQSTTSQGADADTARARAIDAYKDFLTLWKDADPDIPILKQANAEYAKLQ
jgi:tetratricopeptide (TPR) repeat protein